MTLLFLCVLLFVLMTLVGGDRGSVSFLILLANAFLCIIGVLLLSYGIHPMLVLTVSCLLFILLSIPFQNGFHIKTLAAMLSTAAVLVPAAAAIGFVCAHAHIAGLDEYQMNQMENSYLSSGVRLNMNAVILVSLVWGELGAVIDTSITIASSLNEIYGSSPEPKRKELIRTGMQLGKSMIGTTINTLVFIAFGEMILLCLLYRADGYSFSALLNAKSFFQQFGGILFSCESCLLAIPLTVVIYSLLACSKPVRTFFERKPK
jgi:uncharacterized membrane protein